MTKLIKQFVKQHIVKEKIMYSKVTVEIDQRKLMHNSFLTNIGKYLHLTPQY